MTPNLYHALFHQELGDGRRIRLQVWVEDGVPCVAYREDEAYIYVPGGRFPLYKRGYKYCPRCKASREGREVRCPVCHAVMRAKPKKRKNTPNT
ncbi:MAG: hypothetical protein NZ941_07270 [Candidatus Caldarchaeum sp.]|nr:hypothetical protein [Candidatus Caldarchaeum sp.]MDW7978262.1 hypothetical protein [Candidatus Caldarchaeum sp.]